MSEEPEQLTKTEARGGTTPGVARYVLIFSLLLILIIFAIILIVYMRA